MNNNPQNARTVVISGASDGVGKALADLMALKGWVVYDLSRSGEQRSVGGNTVKHITVDVTDEEAVKAAFLRIYNETGKIDAIVANAGFGISGAAEFCHENDIIRLFDVNVFGADRCARAAVPYMRESGGGRIFFTGSVAGVAPIPFQIYYSASKAAVNCLAAGLANELRPFNVSVSSVMLGDSKTGFTAKRKKTQSGALVYGDIISRSVSRMERDEQNGAPPEKIAKAYYKIICKKHPAPVYSIGLTYKIFSLLIKLLPARLVNRLIYIIYGK